jgi:hypothetical protein
MKRQPITLAELDEHLNRRDVLVFDYLVDIEKEMYIEELKDSITDVVEKEGVVYAVGNEVQHPQSKYSYSPWYDISKIFPVKKSVSPRA